MGWSDCGRQSNAQFFYGKKQGRRQVGRCGRFEVRIALYANRLTGRWKKLFKLKFDRMPSDEELWAVLRTGEIAENVKDWEKQPLREEKNPPTRAHVHRSRDGGKMVDVLARYCAEQQLIKEEAIKAKLEEEEAARIKREVSIRRYKICKSSELPREMLQRVVNNKVDIDALCAVFGVDKPRINLLIEAFGLKK